MDKLEDVVMYPFVKPEAQYMYAYSPLLDMEGISVQKEDTPEIGGWIGVNLDNTVDRWYIAKKFHQDKYIRDFLNKPITGAFG